MRYAPPVAIPYGTALSGAQLNATASTAGTFLYAPMAGTVLGGGNQTLWVEFTPADTTNYATATATVQLTVNNAPQTITFTPPSSPVTYGVSPITLVATGGASGNAVVFSVVSGPGTVSGSTLTITGVGTIVVAANQSGNANYAAATQVTQSVIVVNPAPAISGVSPAFTNAGGAAFTLTVSGSGFISGSTVYWGASTLTTTYVSATQLTAQVPAADTATAGTNTITVQTPAPGGGTSNAWQFEVDSTSSGSTAPTITSTTETVTAGSTASYPVTVPSSVTSVSVSCLNLPAGATCSYNTTTNSVTIATTSATPKGTYQIIVVFTETVTSAAFLVPILLLPLGFLRRKSSGRGIRFTACLGLVLLASALLTIGCGSSGGGGSTTPPVTQQVTSSGAVSLTIQ